MFVLRTPSPLAIEAFIRRAADTPFSYHAIGATRTAPPPGFVVDHNRVRLAFGQAAFERATAALRRWEMFNIGWVQLFSTDTPIERHRVVAIFARHVGFGSLNASRIVYTIDEDDGEARRFGFAYGTLTEHVESGEERFMVEWLKKDDSVWYDLYAFSRPRHPLARIAKPLGRALQRRFARDSMAAMRLAVVARP